MDPWAPLKQFSDSAGLTAKHHYSSYVDRGGAAAAALSRAPGQVVGPATLQTIADLQVELAETRAELVAQQIESASLRREREEVFKLFRLRDAVGDRDEYVVELEGTVKALQDRMRDVLTTTSIAETLGPQVAIASGGDTSTATAAANTVAAQRSASSARYGAHHAHQHRKLNIVPRQQPIDTRMAGDSRRSSEDLFGNAGVSADQEVDRLTGRSRGSAWASPHTAPTVIGRHKNHGATFSLTGSDADYRDYATATDEDTSGDRRPVFISTVRGGDHHNGVRSAAALRERPESRSRSSSRATSSGGSAHLDHDGRVPVCAGSSSSRIKVPPYVRGYSASDGPKQTTRVAVDLF